MAEPEPDKKAVLKLQSQIDAKKEQWAKRQKLYSEMNILVVSMSLVLSAGVTIAGIFDNGTLAAILIRRHLTYSAHETAGRRSAPFVNAVSTNSFAPSFGRGIPCATQRSSPACSRSRAPTETRSRFASTMRTSRSKLAARGRKVRRDRRQDFEQRFGPVVDELEGDWLGEPLGDQGDGLRSVRARDQ